MTSCVEVFCDGSVSNSVLTDPYTSVLTGDYVGRAIVIVPRLGEGLIEQTRVGMVTGKGNPASSAAEMFAIRTALVLAEGLGLADFVVYSDCAGEVYRVGDSRVMWRSRVEMYLPNAFFDSVLHRASYLRRSVNVVRARRPLQPYQREQYELFNSPRRQFKLANSALWQRVFSGATTHPDALGLEGHTS